MNKHPLFFLLLTLLVFSCNKRKSHPIEFDPRMEEMNWVNHWIPLTRGLCWTYDVQYVDEDGVVEPLPEVTVRIDDRDYKNGYYYYHFTSDGPGFPLENQWIRDSGGYYVNPTGTRFFSYYDLPNVLQTGVDSNKNTFTCLMDDGFHQRSVEAGEFLCLLRKDVPETNPVGGSKPYSGEFYLARGWGIAEFSCYDPELNKNLDYELTEILTME